MKTSTIANTEEKETVDMATDFTKDHSGTVSHYEVPNLTSMLYEYTNKEQEHIQKCFRVGNFNMIRELPDKFEPNSIIDQIREKQNFNVHFMSKKLESEEPKKQYSKLIGGGLFMKFEYMSDDYDAYLESLKKEKKESKDIASKLHGKSFIWINHLPIANKVFNPYLSTTVEPKGKHKKQFKEGENDNVYPFLREDDPYEAAKDEVLRHKWIEESKNLYGEFKPSKKESSLTIPGRTLFMEILEEVK